MSIPRCFRKNIGQKWSSKKTLLWQWVDLFKEITMACEFFKKDEDQEDLQQKNRKNTENAPTAPFFQSLWWVL